MVIDTMVWRTLRLKRVKSQGYEGLTGKEKQYTFLPIYSQLIINS